MGELMGVGGAGLDYLKSCNKHIFVPKLSASWDAFLILLCTLSSVSSKMLHLILKC